MTSGTSPAVVTNFINSFECLTWHEWVASIYSGFMDRRCGSGAGRIAAVARLRRESDTAGHTAEKVSELTGCRAVEGLPGPGGRERITPFFFHNVLDKKQQSAIINTRVLRLAVSPYWLKFYDENRHLPGWRFSLFTWSVITYPKI